MRKFAKIVGGVSWMSLLLAPAVAMAQVAVPQGGVTIDFATFTAAGFQASPTAGQLDSDEWSIVGFSDGTLAFGGTMTMGDYARGSSTGGVATSGIYAFLDGSDPMFGIQPSAADATPGALTLRLVNNTGQVLAGFQVSYNVLVLNNDGRSTSMDFSYSIDDLNYTAVPNIRVTSGQAADVGAVWTATPATTPVILSVPTDGMFYVRWVTNDVAGGGGRDELGIDDIVIVPDLSAGPDAGAADAGGDAGNAEDASTSGSDASAATDAATTEDGGADAAAAGGAGGAGAGGAPVAGTANAGAAGEAGGTMNNGGSAGDQAAGGNDPLGGGGGDAGVISTAGAASGASAGADGACGCTMVGAPTRSRWSLLALGLIGAWIVRRRKIIV
jgi:MYXO-CTERM domain-containing protein